MDYLRLKKILVCAFDHFLSCHDMAELEEMMQALEAGKSLVIKFPEPIDREDYKNDIEMEAPKPKKIVSRVRRRKPKSAVKTDIRQIKICDVSVLLDLKKLSKEKRVALKEAMSGDHHVTLHDFKMSDIHGFAKARIFKRVEADRESPIVRSFVPKGTQDDNSSSFGGEQVKKKIENASDQALKENLIQKIMFEIKKHKDPP